MFNFVANINNTAQGGSTHKYPNVLKFHGIKFNLTTLA